MRDGLDGASMAAIAAEAGVSKALLHYHFTDRAHLLAEMAQVLGRRLAARERTFFARSEEMAAIDALWQWLTGELTRGELRALLLLGTLKDETVEVVITAAHQVRRNSAATTVEHLFARLGLTPRVAVTLVAEAAMTFNEGLALRGQLDRATARTSFDVFWLAILSLGD